MAELGKVTRMSAARRPSCGEQEGPTEIVTVPDDDGAVEPDRGDHRVVHVPREIGDVCPRARGTRSAVRPTSTTARRQEGPPDSCPTSRLSGFQFSTLTSSDPHTLPPPDLRSPSINHYRYAQPSDPSGGTHGSKSHTMTTPSSLPLARYRPWCAQRTVSTGPLCSASVHSSLGLAGSAAIASERIGRVDHMRILVSEWGRGGMSGARRVEW